MAHTQRNEPRTPSAASRPHRSSGSSQERGQEDPGRGGDSKVTNSARKRAPQAEAGKRHE